jgi:NAD(P)-dependent dehydrogenase (short-subunit alcohol dehydrogenase family)
MTAPLVFITGASSGIGQALAHECLQRGWRVALVARRGPMVQDWLAQHHPAALPQQAGVYVADVGEPEQLQTVAARCMHEMGVPDIVIANAGISLGVDLAQPQDLAVFAEVMRTNVLGVAASFQPFIEPMRSSGVRVVTLAPGYVATPLTARNRYPMPFLMPAEGFARQALDAIALGLSWRVIPWPMAWVARLLRVLPDALFDRLLKGQPRKHRHTDADRR